MTACDVVRRPYRGHEAASEDSMLKGEEGYVVPPWPWCEEGGWISCWCRLKKEVPGHVGWRGKVQLKCGDGGKLLVAVGRAPFRRVRPFQKGAPLLEGARPYCLLDWQGAQAPSGGLVISSSSLMQLRVDEK